MRALETDDGEAGHLEFWFEFASNYSYLSVMRIEQAAAQHRVRVQWRPFLLGPIFQSFGWNNSPFVLQKLKGEYVWQDMVRQCAKYQLPWRQPTQFPRASLLGMRVAILGAEQPWIGAYCRELMQMNFAEDRDIGRAEVVAESLHRVGLPASDLIAAAQSEANKLKLRTQTEQAQARGLFGAPSFFVHGDLYWGNDRLDDALDDCVRRRRG